MTLAGFPMTRDIKYYAHCDIDIDIVKLTQEMSVCLRSPCDNPHKLLDLDNLCESLGHEEQDAQDPILQPLHHLGQHSVVSGIVCLDQQLPFVLLFDDDVHLNAPLKKVNCQLTDYTYRTL